MRSAPLPPSIPNQSEVKVRQETQIGAQHSTGSTLFSPGQVNGVPHPESLSTFGSSIPPMNDKCPFHVSPSVLSQQITF